MKLTHYSVLIIAVLLCGCKTEFSKFNDDALAFSTNDKRIDQKEYESLVEQINLSDEKGFQNFKSESGKIDDNKIVAYLLKYY